MTERFDNLFPLTELELSRIWDEAASKITWVRRQILITEGLDPNLDCSGREDDFLALLPLATFGSDLWLKRQILPVLCLAYQDIEKQINDEQARRNADPDKYVHLIIPLRHKKFRRLAGELQADLPWIASVLDPTDEASALAVLSRINHLGIRAHVRIRYADLNEERIVT